MSGNLDFGYHSIGFDQREHFEAGELQNLLNIGVASHEVGVAEDKVSGAAAPTNYIENSTRVHNHFR